jgi:hypothetical protein
MIWKCKNNMKIRYGKEFLRSRGNPLMLFMSLTGRAMPIATRVELQMEFLAVHTPIQMPSQGFAAAFSYAV